MNQLTMVIFTNQIGMGQAVPAPVFKSYGNLPMTWWIKLDLFPDVGVFERTLHLQVIFL